MSSGENGIGISVGIGFIRNMTDLSCHGPVSKKLIRLGAESDGVQLAIVVLGGQGKLGHG